MFGLVPFMARKNLQRGNDSFQDGMQRVFDIFNDPFFSDMMTTAGNIGGSNFKVDVKDNGNAFELIADLPGLSKENISLNYENNYLTIATKVESGTDEKDDKGNYIHRERRSGSMSRSFYIDNIDEKKISAEFKDGILKIEMPKLAEETPKATQIEIK